MRLLRAAPVELEDTLAGDPFAVRAPVLAMAALGPLITGYAAVAAVLAVVTSVAARATFSTTGVLAAAAPGWLAAHQVPLRIEGAELGVLPLLPTIAAAVLVARTASAAAERLDLRTPRTAGHLVALIAAGHAVFGLVLGLSTVGGPVTVNLVAAPAGPAVLAGLAATVGVARHAGLLDLAFDRIDPVTRAGLGAGAVAVAVLLAAGAVLFGLGLATGFTAAGGMFQRTAGGLGGNLGLLLLCAGYLPNGVVAGTSFVAGPGFSLGAISVAPLNFTGGPVPDLPLLAALPDRAAGWWTLLLAVPVGVGVLIGRLLREVSEVALVRLHAVGVALAVLVLSLAVLAALTGGALGGGRFDPVDLHPVRLALALLVWVGVVAAVVVSVSRPRWSDDDLYDEDELDPLDEEAMEDPDEEPVEEPGEDAAEPDEDAVEAEPAEEPDDEPEPEPVAGEEEPVKKDLADESD
ncbi:DUF6350 family protein [Actinophytocola sp.]|uniref:cell division protein PerM n=1 Tax=Actinophytocola sp. TaxID=1872138 RepID=UPI002D810509|nr:DUF6350 family protein [Actinophytocola sp.]HET9140263.1 DUF6350 family protein [Actinophytocola sp.]